MKRILVQNTIAELDSVPRVTADYKLIQTRTLPSSV
jgi:hypothetical protein